MENKMNDNEIKKLPRRFKLKNLPPIKDQRQFASAVGCAGASIAEYEYNSYVTSGNEIKLLREHMGLTQTEFADKLGVSRRTIYRWEMKRHKPLPVFQKLIKEIAESVK